jgi:hypothetical protein
MTNVVSILMPCILAATPVLASGAGRPKKPAAYGLTARKPILAAGHVVDPDHVIEIGVALTQQLADLAVRVLALCFGISCECRVDLACGEIPMAIASGSKQKRSCTNQTGKTLHGIVA